MRCQTWCDVNIFYYTWLFPTRWLHLASSPTLKSPGQFRCLWRIGLLGVHRRLLLGVPATNLTHAGFRKLPAGASSSKFMKTLHTVSGSDRHRLACRGRHATGIAQHAPKFLDEASPPVPQQQTNSPSRSDLCVKGTESFARSESEEMAKSAVAPLPTAPKEPGPRLQCAHRQVPDQSPPLPPPA